MNEDEDPLKINLPDSDYKSVNEDFISPEDSDNSSVERYLPEIAKKKRREDISMSNNNPQAGSQANNNNNLPMPTAEEYYRMVAIVQRLEAAAAAPPPPPLPPQHMSRAESRFRRFSEAVRKTHDSANPECAILTSNGSNFQIWEEEVNRTLDGVFDTNVPFLSADANFEALGRDEAKSVVTLFRTTISKELRTIVGGPSVKTPLDMYKSIKLNCKHSDRQHKLRIVNRLVTLVKSKVPSTETTLSSWTSTVTELEQLQVSVSELYGLLLQNGFVAPTGIDKKTFEFTVDSKLETKESATFAEVSTVIQSACGQHKNKTIEPSNSYTPMELDAIQAFRQSQGKYVPPNQRNPRLSKINQLPSHDGPTYP
ncbi:hypothetical protein KEM48_014003 [Puccinia striiformis f. sp. tritici PST-130]|nr:hypothetical protein KEM48_014003 [Puccinia striiformis f. sp. tritici PST-130]